MDFAFIVVMDIKANIIDCGYRIYGGIFTTKEAAESYSNKFPGTYVIALPVWNVSKGVSE